ncbi:uncharacterized protein LOC119190706 [Manduca sexta]|uniref:uncharacterized protein LOC119190706 n=1 Tax=Manduca sexta TaxID=7130 RepID=UPI001890432C|nr:uncharacterized protein LOC119190706 [Manduca sexta]
MTPWPGLGRAYQSALREERVAEAARAVEEEAALQEVRIVAPCPKIAAPKSAKVPTKNLLLEVAENIRHVSQASRNLKGTFVKALKEDAAKLQERAEEPSSAETARLEAIIASLERKVTALEAALATQNKILEDFVAGDRSREPKAASKKRRRIASSGMRDGWKLSWRKRSRRSRPNSPQRPSHARQWRRWCLARPGQPSGRGGVGQQQHSRLRPDLLTFQLPPRPRSCSHTCGRGACPTPAASAYAGSRRRAATPLPQSAPAPTTVEEGWTVRQKVVRKVVPQLRLPKKAAVTLTVAPEAVERGTTYAQALQAVRGKVDLASLGIGVGMKARRVATGAYLFEVPGPESEAKADSLVIKMREALCGLEGVRVSRPVMTAELRISGLDESVTPDDVATAIAKIGECSIEDLKVGQVKIEHSGLGAAWAQCPAKVADKVARAGRVLVGFVSAGVRLLEPRPQRCYRCLCRGHVGAKCTAGVDRSGICYRCGLEGHKAKGCSAEPHCAVCAAAGKPAGHRVGGKDCVASSTLPQPSRRRCRGCDASATVPPSGDGDRPLNHGTKHFLQANINHCARAQDLLVQSLAQWSIHVAVVSEPYFVPRDDWAGDSDGSVAVITGVPPAPRPSKKSREGYRMCGGSVGGVGSGSLLLPNRSLAEFESFLIRLGTLVVQSSQPRPVLVAGDFNAKSLAWGSSVTDARGWRVLVEEETLSDHRYIRFSVSTPRTNQPSNSGSLTSRRWGGQRWAVTRLNREAVKEAALVQAWFPVPAGPVRVEEEAEWFGGAMSQICDAAMPRARCLPPKRQVYWWSAELTQLRASCMAARRRLARHRRRHSRPPGDDEQERLLHGLHKTAKRALRVAIAQAKAAAREESRRTLDSDPWGRPYRMALSKLRPWAPR